MINSINKDLIKELRRRTGISLIRCKKALIESNGDIELAIDNIRKSGLLIDLHKSRRSTESGLIAVKIASDHQTGLMVEIKCETDFVARNNIFQKFSEIVLDIASHESINDIDILKTKVQPQCSILMNQIGENVKINRFVVLKGNFLSSYVHGLKIGVIVSASGKIDKNIIKHIAMHIAARNPIYIHRDDVPEEIITKEHCIQTDIAMKSGKSQKVIEKIVMGRVDKFLTELVLTKQDFIIDIAKSVGDVLDEYSIKIDNFIRFEIGNNY